MELNTGLYYTVTSDPPGVLNATSQIPQTGGVIGVHLEALVVPVDLQVRFYWRSLVPGPLGERKQLDQPVPAKGIWVDVALDGFDDLDVWLRVEDGVLRLQLWKGLNAM